MFYLIKKEHTTINGLIFTFPSEGNVFLKGILSFLKKCFLRTDQKEGSFFRKEKNKLFDLEGMTVRRIINAYF
jgi:hypothetical protein